MKMKMTVSCPKIKSHGRRNVAPSSMWSPPFFYLDHTVCPIPLFLFVKKHELTPKTLG